MSQPTINKISKIVQTGNSLAITIPAKFAKKIGIKLGDDVRVKTNPTTGTLTAEFTSMRQLPLIK